ncbi:hypothetical protein [Streptomyces sp. LN704]|uniref:hypothetical protein n=1 Tax=Streptomyces sp. LN704 TaxID=3112982 RepID=UPI0037179A40
MSVRLALHWALVTLTAALASTAAAIPFTGDLASAMGTCAAGGVCLIGIALAPAPVRKDGSR